MVSGFANIFFGEEEHLAHCIGDCGGFDKGGHAIFAEVDEGDVVAEDIDFDWGSRIRLGVRMS